MKTFDVQVNDYVKWHHNNNCDEGWVYFKCDEYITIEVGVKPKPYCNVVKNMLQDRTHHKSTRFPISRNCIDEMKLALLSSVKDLQ